MTDTGYYESSDSMVEAAREAALHGNPAPLSPHPGYDEVEAMMLTFKVGVPFDTAAAIIEDLASEVWGDDWHIASYVHRNGGGEIVAREGL